MLLKKMRSALSIIKKFGFIDFFYRLVEYLRNLRYRVVFKDYPSGLEKDGLEKESMERQKSTVDEFTYLPLFSFITPVYNPPPQALHEMLQSVYRQTYSRWELCMVNASTDPAIQHVIDYFSREDPRMKSVKIKNKGIAANSNHALMNASGDFIVLLDHDDVVAPDLLFEVAKVLNTDQSLDIIYYNEDIIDTNGARKNPRFKPKKFHSGMFRYINYLTHCVIRKSLVEKAGEFNPEFDGAQDWELLFRCIEESQKIQHINRVLYSWRRLKGSTAMGMDEKPYAREKQERARWEHKS